MRRGFGVLVELELRRLEKVARDAQRRDVAFPFPRDLTELRVMQDWVVEGLIDAGVLPRGREVTDYQVQPFASDLAFRSVLGLVTVRWDDDELVVVAKMAPAVTDLRDHAIYLMQKNQTKEVGFYDVVGPHSTIGPRAYRTAVDARTGHYCVLMEYLGGLTGFSEREGAPPEQAYALAEHLARFHAANWGLPDGRPDVLEKLPDVAIDWFAHNLEGPHRDVWAAIAAHCWRHDLAEHQTLIHGDCRVGNVLFPSADQPDRLVAYDWQAFRTGRGVFDLVYFMVLSMDTERRRAHWKALLDRYHRTLMASGVPATYTRDVLEDDAFNAVLLTGFFVTAPFLLKEASTSDENTEGLDELKNVWAPRLYETLRHDVDWTRCASWTGLDEARVQAAAVALPEPFEELEG